MKSKKYTIIVPEFAGESNQPIRHWLESLREVKLMGELNVVSLPWKEGITGCEEDWFAVLQAIQANWEDSEGILIWAPEHSLILLGGFLRLLMDQPGKPIVLFAADRPSKIENKQLKKYALVSVLVNAVYAASSDLAEVVLLSEQSILRPDGCYWGQGQLGPALQSAFAPLAKLQLSLQLFGDYHGRTNAPLRIRPLEQLEKRVFHHHWQPSLLAAHPEQIAKAVLLQTEEHYRHHPRLEQLAQSWQELGAEVLWYQADTLQPSADQSLHHPNPWWALLSSQVAFGLKQDQKQAAALVKTLMHQA